MHPLLTIRPLIQKDFAPFGDVIAAEGRDFISINDNTAKKFCDLATIDVLAEAGRPMLCIYDASPVQLPPIISKLERHPLSSQAFIPLHDHPFLVVVADAGETIQHRNLHAFITNGSQGVNYKKNTWHHFLLALKQPARFLVVERGGSGKNCDEYTLDNPVVLKGTPDLFS